MANFRHSFILSALAAAMIVTGCHETVHTVRPTVPAVERILTSDCREATLLSAFDPTDSKGVISVVGSSEDVSRLSELLLSFDEFDNVDGKLEPDQLPDFAGEVIHMVGDDANTPYHALIEKDMTDSLRALPVHHLLNAIDTLCSFGSFDADRGMNKMASKLVVYASPYFAEFGAFDVDTLCRTLSADVPVIYPSKTVMSQILDNAGQNVHIAVITDSLTASDGVHAQIFNEMCRERSLKGNDCVAFASDTARGDALVNMLEAYRASGGIFPLTAIVVDDSKVSASDIQASADAISSVTSAANLNYRKLLAPDCKIIDTYTVAAQECYRILRRRNIFTHNISYPQVKAYLTVPASEGEGFRLIESYRYVQD